MENVRGLPNSNSHPIGITVCMTVQCRWRTTLATGEPVEIVRQRDGEGDEDGEVASSDRLTYSLRVPAAPASPNGPTLECPTATGISVDRPSDDSDPEFLVTVPSGSGIVRLYVRDDGHRDPLYLPGPDFLENCTDAIDGDTDAARAVLDEFAVPTQIPAVCGEFLTISALGDLLETLAAVNGYTASYLHAYRYDLVRGAIVSDTGLSVQSADELESLVESVDAVENIGPVDLVDVLSDTVATVHASGNAARSLLESLGYDIAAVERYDDELFFAVYLARLVLADGVRAAEGHTMRRRRHLDGNYKRRKMRAKNANYADRGRAWRKLLCPAARQSLDEFAYVLANACYWSGENTRTDSRMDELLFDAAARVASEIGLDQIEGRARYEARLSRGHRLRSQKCYSLARAAFERAGDIATEYEFLPEWEPIYTIATVHSAEHGTTGDHAQAVAVLDDALERLFEYDIAPAKLNHIVHHLEGQKLESKAQLANGQSDGDDPVALLREARTHYDVIDLDRSSERVQRKLQRATRSEPATGSSPDTPEQSREATSESQDDRSSPSAATAESAETEATSTDVEDTSGPENRHQKDPASAETSGSSTRHQRTPPRERRERTPSQKRHERTTGGHVRSDHAQTELEPNPELDDFLAPPDPDEVGSADLMTSPDNRDDTPHTGVERGWGDGTRTDPDDSY